MSPSRLTRRLAASLALMGALSACTMGHDASKDAVSHGGSSSGNPSSSSSPTNVPSSSTQADAKQIWATTQAGLAKATSVKVNGTDSPNGTGANVAFSGKLSGDPSEVVFKDATLGDFTMRRIAATVYLKGDTTYWKAVEKESPKNKGATEMANRWISLPVSEMDKDDLSKMIAKTYIGAIADTHDPKWGVIGDSGSKLTSEKLDGRDADKIVSPDGDTTVWVATDSTHQLLKVHDEAAGDNDLGQATFTGWNTDFKITKPSGAIRGGNGGGGGNDDGGDTPAASPQATT